VLLLHFTQDDRVIIDGVFTALLLALLATIGSVQSKKNYCIGMNTYLSAWFSLSGTTRVLEDGNKKGGLMQSVKSMISRVAEQVSQVSSFSSCLSVS
jgi:hypothetical protein